MKPLLTFMLCLSTMQIVYAQTLVERLGYKKTDRLLIINNDDAGMCHAANSATMKGMEEGMISSATIMMPCPWSNEMIVYAKENPDKGFGVHLTLTAEWKNYRWSTLTSREQVPGLYDPQGYMWKDVEEVYAASNTQEALIEGRAQIQKALDAGVPVTHIDSHMGTYQYAPEYMHIYLQLAEEYNLPVRMPSAATLQRMGAPDFREICRQKGIICPDYFIHEEFADYKEENLEQFWTNYLKALKPGVTEIYIHGAVEGDEIRAITGSAPTRIKELAFFSSDQLKQLLKEEGIIVISYRPLFELQRKEGAGKTANK